MENNNSCINLGGKGSSLSSSSVFAIANDLAKLGFENSALQRLAIADSRYGASVKPYKLDFPNLLTLEEKKSALVVIFNNLLLFSAATDTIRSILPSRISSALDDTSRPLEIDLTEEEVRAVEILRPISVLYGAIALVDHKSSALSAIADAVAAISCESSRSDVSAFELTDPGDGSADKDEIGIAADVKVLLNGSKLVGKVKSEEAVSRIPKVHAFLRKQSRLVHSVARVELKSAVKSGSGAADTVRNLFSSLATALWDFGRYSYGRAKLNLDSMVDGDVKSSLVGLFEEKCPSADTLRSESKVVSELVFGGEENYDSLGHQVNVLVGLVWKIVAWEAITAFVALEGAELKEKSQDGEVTSVNKKSEKKKKVVLGKGTSVLIQVIKNRLGSKVSGSDGSGGLLEKWVEELLSFFNPKDIEFDNLLSKVKEIVEGNEARRLPKPPKGTRDFSKEQMTVRKKAFSIIEGVFEKHGATALDTPVFELSDVLKGKYGEDSKLIYDLADQGGEHLSLRYDLTVPFARHMASNGLTSLKRYQIGKVYRRDNPSKGRYREFYQCDFDIAGQYERMGPDFEVIKILTELLDKLNIGDYEIKLNHRRLLDGMLEICGVPPEKFRAICSSIDKLDKQSFDQIKIEMVEEKGLTEETADKIGTFVKERGPPLELFGKLKREGSKFLENSSSIDALNDLEILFEALEKSKCINRVTFDLSLARGLDYYTGVIFEAVFRGGTQVGSIAAGGRYDNLIGMFGSKQVPAVGVSLGIERVFTIMEQLQKDQNQKTRASKTDVLVSILGDDLSQAAELVSELWDAEMYAEFSVSKRLNKHFDRAKESKIPWMLIQGERERNEGRVRIKDFESSNEDVVVPRSRVVEELKARLNPSK